MKRPKKYLNIISNSKDNNASNNKANDIINQMNLLNKHFLKSKNGNLNKISLKFKTQKSSPKKTLPKSLSKISYNGNSKNIEVNKDSNKNITKSKIINNELNQIFSNINNNRNKILMNYNSNKISKIKKKQADIDIPNTQYQKTQFNNRNIKAIPENYHHLYNNYIDKTLNSTASILYKNGIKSIPNKNTFNLNISINQFKLNKNKFRNNNIIPNNTTTNIININNNVNNIINNNNNIQYIYTNQNLKKNQIVLKPNKNSIRHQSNIFNKIYYRNISTTTPVTMNNSRKSSAEKKIRIQNNENNLLNNNFMIRNKTTNKNLNLYNKIKNNYSNERITNSNSHSGINKLKYINKKIINHTTVNSPHRNQIFLNNQNIHNNYNIKIPNLTAINSRDISNISNLENISNNNNNNIFYLNIQNRNKSFKYYTKNKRAKTISQKQSFNDLIESNSKNKTENIESILDKNISNLNQNENNINNNTPNNIIQIYKKAPKIIDIKRTLVNKNKKNKNDLNNNIPDKIINIFRPNLKLNNSNFKINIKKGITTLNSNSNSKMKSLSKNRVKSGKNRIKIMEFNSLIEDIKKIKKRKIEHRSNITSNPSYKNSLNNSNKNKTVTVTASNSNNTSIFQQNITKNLPFDIEKKEKKISLLKQGIYYSKESERLSNYIKEYYRLNDTYPKSQVLFYKYGRLIGKGAFGKVNLGLHALTGRIVAIKSFNKSKLKSERAKDKIYHEINLMKNLRHKYIVKILDTFETENYILIVMENISGGDLLSFVKKRTKLNEKISRYIFKQILEAIKYIHSKNIVHRDIKLDNVLIDLNNNIKLCDFGVGKIIQENEILDEQCGTPAYIAPEILENKGYVGWGVDVWSSGVVLYAMLSGTVPFKANNLHDLQNIIISGNFKEINDISKPCNDLLHKLLEINPKKRISIDEALKHPWIVGNNNTNEIFEDNKLTLFTKAEIVLLSKNFVDYRNCDKSEMIENFTLKNLDTKNIIENKNNLTKSFIFAPFNTSYIKEELNKAHLIASLEIENNIILFDENIQILNRQYELNNNGEIDHGVLINRFNMSSRRSNNLNEPNKNTKEKKGDNSVINEEEKNDKKEIDLTQEEKIIIKNRNKNNNINSEITFSDNDILDENVIINMQNLGYDKKYIKKCITNNELNYCSATYYLLLLHNDKEIDNKE